MSARREALLESLSLIPPVAEAKSILADIEETYSGPHWCDIPMKRTLASAYRTMVEVMRRRTSMAVTSEIDAAVNYLVKFVQAGGIAVTLSQSSASKRATTHDVIVEFKAQPSHDIPVHVEALINV